MKAFAIWLVGFVVAFGLYAGIDHAVRSSDPERVLVVVDSSFAMRGVWGQIPRTLDAIDDGRYSEYALITEKRTIQGWGDRLTLGAVDPFAPCGFDAVASNPLVAEADRVIVITTSGSCPTDTLPSNWEVRLLG